jgi:hypothetical protein
MPISSSANRRIVKASAIYDLVLTASFATPWTFALAHGQFSSLNAMLGGATLPAFTPFHVLFACLMGSIVLVWSTLRILEPTQRLGRFDGTARFLFSLWMAWCLLVTGAPVLWLFVLPEVAWGVAQWWPVRGQRDGQRYNGVLPRTSQAC